jgi:hypothetical protein
MTQFMAADVAIYTSGVLSTKEIELISIALDASPSILWVESAFSPLSLM